MVLLAHHNTNATIRADQDPIRSDSSSPSSQVVSIRPAGPMLVISSLPGAGVRESVRAPGAITMYRDAGPHGRRPGARWPLRGDLERLGDRAVLVLGVEGRVLADRPSWAAPGRARRRRGRPRPGTATCGCTRRLERAAAEARRRRSSPSPRRRSLRRAAAPCAKSPDAPPAACAGTPARTTLTSGMTRSARPSPETSSPGTSGHGPVPVPT